MQSVFPAEKIYNVRNIGRMIVLFGLSLICVVWIGLFIKVESEKELEKNSAIKETKNFARTFEEHTLRTIRGADQAVLFLKSEYEREGRAIDIPGYVKEGRFSSQPFVLMGVIDENGLFAISNQVPFVPSNLSDREHFLVHVAKDSKQLFISKPVLGRSSGKWSIQMTRRINKPDGSFGGVVVISVDPFYFTEFYKELDLGPNSTVTLVGYDRIVRARQAGQNSEVGQDLTDSEFSALLEKSPDGSFISHSSIDGVKRIYSYRSMKDYPLAVVVGVDEQAYYEALNERVQGYYMVAGLVTVAILVFILGILYAVRRQISTETALKYMLDSLEEQVSERTKELKRKNSELESAYRELQNAQSQVIHQEKMASIGQLAAGVAHEINNPLGFTISNFETLKKYMAKFIEVLSAYRAFRCEALTLSETELQQKMEEIVVLERRNKVEYILNDIDTLFHETQDGLTRVGDIVKALRMFSRIDTQGVHDDYDLNEGVRNSLIVARNEIKYIAEIREELSDIPLVSAIGGQINQVLLNLILNAAYAIKEKGSQELGLITVCTYVTDGMVCCSVQDNGKGIPSSIQKDIFNPFFTTKPVGQGTGLGLSISYDIIVNKHQGKIFFDSIEGEGTTFFIQLPAMQQ
jgi:signal transduction histidine kinase